MDRAKFERWLRRRTNRRALLTRVGAVALAISLPGRPTARAGRRQDGVPPPPRFSANPFALGVASGDPLPDGVVLWTRLAPEPLDGGGMDGRGSIEVGWEVAADARLAEVVQRGAAVATPELGHAVHVDVQGLEPGRDYFYRFTAGGEESVVGRTRTAPVEGAAVDRLRFAVASCAQWEHGFFGAYRHLAAEDLDLVLFLGDYLYEYAAGVALPDGATPVRLHTGGEPATLADYRARHALYKTDPDLQRAHAAVPWVVTWDDHEVDNNYAADRSENDDPPEMFLARRAAAYQAFYEHLPLRPDSMPRGPAMQLYRRLTFGDLAELSVLDTRQYRTDHPCGDNLQVRCPAALDPATTMTGPEQERWLLAGLDASSARWNVIAQQVLMAELDTDPGDGQEFAMDMWDGYPAARNRILGHVMSRGTRNPVVLTGDIHAAWVNDLKADYADPNSAVVATEFVATSISAINPFADRLRFAPLLYPHLKHFDARHGYARCDVTPDRWQTDLRAMETAADPSVPIETIASFVVEDGQPGAQPA